MLVPWLKLTLIGEISPTEHSDVSQALCLSDGRSISVGRRLLAYRVPVTGGDSTDSLSANVSLALTGDRFRPASLAISKDSLKRANEPSSPISSVFTFGRSGDCRCVTMHKAE